jgi:hypothetical protein
LKSRPASYGALRRAIAAKPANAQSAEHPLKKAASEFSRADLSTANR